MSKPNKLISYFKRFAGCKSHSSDTFTVKSFVFLFVFTVIILIGISWYAWKSYGHFRDAEAHKFRAVELSGIIMHYDEVLTMSARMAASTERPYWEERYRKFEPQLDSAIKEAMELFEDTSFSDAASQTDVANIKLVAMENKAFELVRQGNRQAAEQVLYSEDYEKQKKIYKKGMLQFTEVMRRHVKDELERYRKAALISIGFVGVAISLTIFIWIGVLRALRRINERKTFAHTLERQKQELQIILDSVRALIFYKDKNNRIIRVNKAFAEFIGWDIKDLINKPSSEVFGEKTGIYWQEDKQVLEFGLPRYNIIKTVETAKGLRWLQTDKIPYKNQNGDIIGVISFSVDITDQKRTEQIQLQLLTEIEEINQELKDFAYITSHDLKAPLRGIKTLAEWVLIDYGDKLPEEGREQLNMLLGRVDRMYALIDGILQYSRVGRIKEKKVPVDIGVLVNEAIDMLSPPEHIEIIVDDQLPVIICEETRIMQVFGNLLSNAVKYMDKPDGQIRISCADDGEFWKFSVSDNGPGIEEKHFGRIFKIFQTLSTHDECESTGIGLTIVKKIVGLYDGQIWVESEPGQGTTFFFTLKKEESGELYDEKLQAYIACRG